MIRSVFALLAGAVTVTAAAQVVPLDPGKYKVKLDRAVKAGPPQTTGATPFALQSTPGVKFFVHSFNSLGTPLPVAFIGGNPSVAGAGTTTIPTTFVPLAFEFWNAPGIILDGGDIIPTTVASPVFQKHPFTSGPTRIGNTQYLDAVMRAQFWNYARPRGISPDYHLLLGTPVVARTLTLFIPKGFGFLAVTNSGVLFGLIDFSKVPLDTIFLSVMKNLNVTADQLPMFLARNLLGYEGTLDNCCIGGYHNSESGPGATAQTWVYASYLDISLFGPSFADLVPLSHEIAEWANDPFVGANFTDRPGVNWVPPSIAPGVGCLANFETGDVVEGLRNGSFAVTVNGTTYHLEDEAYLYWFTHQTPSPAANGWYVFQNALPTFGKFCTAG